MSSTRQTGLSSQTVKGVSAIDRLRRVADDTSALPPSPGWSEISLDIGRPIVPADIPALCERVRVSLEDRDAGVIVCDVGALAHPDAVAIDALARMQLTALRRGRRIRLDRASYELQELLAMMGLYGILPLCRELPLESIGQAEEREQASGVEKEADSGDPTG